MQTIKEAKKISFKTIGQSNKTSTCDSSAARQCVQEVSSAEFIFWKPYPI